MDEPHDDPALRPVDEASLVFIIMNWCIEFMSHKVE